MLRVNLHNYQVATLFVVLLTVPLLLHRMTMTTLDSESEDERPKPKRQEGGKAVTANNKKTAEEPAIAWEVVPAVDYVEGTLAELKPATLCACAKCGTTSLYQELFLIVQGKSFKSMKNYSGPPWVQDLWYKELWTNIHAKRKTDWSNFKNQDSFALIRDPKERIVSAWKSKVTCDGNKEITGHKMFVPQLLELAGPSNITARTDKGWPCLDLSDYLAVLSQIHAQGKEGSLNRHFLPQHLGCFKNAPPSMWTVVTTISDPTALCSLDFVVSRSANMSNTHDDCQRGITKTHSTSELTYNFTRADEDILDRITSKEYEMLGPYLAAKKTESDSDSLH
eukprot:scaffold344_cov132-Skeletonema_menzelii.AAC.11